MSQRKNIEPLWASDTKEGIICKLFSMVSAGYLGEWLEVKQELKKASQMGQTWRRKAAPTEGKKEQPWRTIIPYRTETLSQEKGSPLWAHVKIVSGWKRAESRPNHKKPLPQAEGQEMILSWGSCINRLRDSLLLKERQEACSHTRTSKKTVWLPWEEDWYHQESHIHDTEQQATAPASGWQYTHSSSLKAPVNGESWTLNTD